MSPPSSEVAIVLPAVANPSFFISNKLAPCAKVRFNFVVPIDKLNIAFRVLFISVTVLIGVVVPKWNANAPELTFAFTSEPESKTSLL